MQLAIYNKIKNKLQYMQRKRTEKKLCLNIADKANFPSGFIKVFIGDEPAFEEIKKELVSQFTSVQSYEFPSISPTHSEYKTISPKIKLDQSFDFKKTHYVDHVLKRSPSIYKIFELPEIDSMIRSYFKKIGFDGNYNIYHVSSYRTFPGDENEQNYGFQEWHTDAFPFFCKKLLIYLSDVSNDEEGPTQFMGSGSSPVSILGKAGTAFLLDQNQSHRGSKPRTKTRDVVYFSLCPSVNQHTVIQALGTDAAYPLDYGKAILNGYLRQYAHERSLLPKNMDQIVGVNLGGGTFTHSEWINLDIRDTIKPEKNQFLCDFSKKNPLPFKDNSLSYVYSSHCFEHLEIPVITHLLGEAKRILAQNGTIVLKLPDFDHAIESYKKKDYSFFLKKWGIEEFEDNWLIHGKEINIKNYFLMVLSSYANMGAGSLYKNERNSIYYGPPEVSQEVIDEKVNSLSVRELSEFLNQQMPSSAHIRGHITAFSKEDVIALLKKSGFSDVEAFSQNCSSTRFDGIKSSASNAELERMQNISVYYVAKS